MNSNYAAGDVVICGGGDLWGNGAGQRAVLMAKVATGGDRVGSVMWRCRFADGEGRFAYGVDRNLYECQFIRQDAPKQVELTRENYEAAKKAWAPGAIRYIKDDSDEPKLPDSPELTECKKKHPWLFELASGYKWAEAEDVRDSHDELQATTQRLSKIKDAPKQVELTRENYEAAQKAWAPGAIRYIQNNADEPTFVVHKTRSLGPTVTPELMREGLRLEAARDSYEAAWNNWNKRGDFVYVDDDRDELLATTQRLSKIKDDRIAELEAENKQLKAAVLQAQEMAKEIAANSVPKKTVEAPSAGQALANALRADRPLDAYGR